MAEALSLDEWEAASSAAYNARENVAQQLTASLHEREQGGAKAMVIRRLKELREAELSGEPEALRAAVFEFTLAGAEWVVSLDLEAEAGR